MTYIVDTEIIDKLVNGEIHLEDLPDDRPFVAVSAQIDRLGAASQEAHRAKLLLKFGEFTGCTVSTEMVTMDGSPWERLQLCNGILFKKVKDGLEKWCDTKSNTRDILLANVAISNKLILVTTNEYLADVVRNLGGEAVHFAT